MVITKTVLDDLIAQAKASPRLRMNMDLRNGPEDGSQRMLNAIEPGSPLLLTVTASAAFSVRSSAAF